MPYILIVSHNATCRRLYVDNLVRRGYLAVGAASATEAQNLFTKGLPALVIACCMPVTYQRDIEQVRMIYDRARPLVLIAEDRPNPAWAAAHNVGVRLATEVDPRRLIDTLQPWLADRHAD